MTNRRTLTFGFSLIELMIALAIGMVVLLGLTVMFSMNSSNQKELEETVRRMENARFSMDILREDIWHAGYFSDFNPDMLLVQPAYQNPANPCATSTASLGWDTSTSPVKMPLPVQAVASGTTLSCLTNRVAGTEAIIIRHADTGNSIQVKDALAGNLYIQISRCKDDLNRLVVAEPSAPTAPPAPPAASPFTLRGPACAAVNDAVRRLTQRIYYIASCNDCTNNDGIPTLKRVEMINGELHSTAIAEGIENLQFEYGFDGAPSPRGDGVVDVYLVTPDGAAPNTLNNVIAVRFHFLARSSQKTNGYAGDERTYKLGPNVSVVKPNDGYKRTLVSTTVRLQNVGGRRE